MKTTWNKKRTFMLAVGILVLAAVVGLLCLLLLGDHGRQEAQPSAEPTATAQPTAAPSAALPSATPEPAITPPASQPGNAASGSDIQISIQPPATESDLSPVE